MLSLIKLLTWIASPTGILTVLSTVALALLLAKKAPRLRLLLIFIGVGQLLFFAHPWASSRICAGLETQARVIQAQNRGAPYGAILVLGGGIRPRIDGLQSSNAGEAFDRVIEAARLYQQGLAPVIIVSGGNSLRERYPQAQAEAEAMKEALVLMGIPEAAIRSEDRSQTTRQNMELTAPLLKDWSIRGRLALVTSATHMPRATKNAGLAGLATDAYPTDWTTPDSLRPFVGRWLPNAQALEESERAIKEWIALIAG